MENKLKRGPAILSDVSFQAKSGDVVGILGENGAGKTTLLSIMTGILKQQRGMIRFGGKTLSAKQRRALSYLVMQDADYQLFSGSVAEEMTLGIDDDDDTLRQRVDAALEMLGLSEYRDRHPASLSGGQKQRVTIGAAMVKGSQVVYFDEPTSGLDYDAMVRVSGMIQSLAASGAIVFVVSHDFEFIVRTCTQVLRLDGAKAVQHTGISPALLRTLSQLYFAEGG